MSKQRLVDTAFWDDGYVVTLDPSEKLLFMYLLTNPLTSICGVYEISLKRIGFDTGFDHDTIKKLLERLEHDDKAVYRDGWIALKNWIKHQSDSPKVSQGIENQLKAVPVSLAKYVRGYPMDTVSHPNPNTNPNPNPNAIAAKAASANGLHKAVQDAFVAKHGEFTDYGKEGMAIKRLIAKAEKAFPDEPAAFLRGLLEAFWTLKQSGDRFWGDQPFLPSALNASGIYDRVCEKLRASAPVSEEITEAIEGVFK